MSVFYFIFSHFAWVKIPYKQLVFYKHFILLKTQLFTWTKNTIFLFYQNTTDFYFKNAVFILTKHLSFSLKNTIFPRKRYKKNNKTGMSP